jgi:hypothetical protein
LKSGSFQALGQEIPSVNRRNNPTFFIAAGLLAYIVALFAILTLNASSPYVRHLPGWDDFLTYYFIIGFPTVIILGFGIWYHNAGMAEIRLLNIEYTDDRSDNGNLIIQYSDTKVAQPEVRKLLIKEIKISQTEPLSTPQTIRGISFKDRNTLCSVEFRSKTGSRNLRLGFDSVANMEKATPLLDSKNDFIPRL